MKRIISCLLVLFVANILQAAPIVNFNDPNLKAAVEAELGISNPTTTDMLLLTFLDANSLGISDLTGLEWASNLQRLHLSDNKINNLSQVYYLTNLKTLKLAKNQLTSLSNLAGLNLLEYLHLNDNLGINNLSPLSGLTNLKNLLAQDCNISNINPVSSLTQLKRLQLNNNEISDINAVSGLTNLTYLNLNDNYITDISPLQLLTKLQYLYLSRNDDISDINVISDMNSLAELGLIDVNLSNITPLADVNQIKYLWISYNFIEDIGAITNYKNLTRLNLYRNPMNFDSWCVYLKQIIDNKPSASIGSNVLIDDRSTDIDDLRYFASKWLRQDCSLSNAFCGETDFNESGKVDFWDFAVLADWWMYQP